MILFLNSGREKKTRRQSLPVICKHVQYKYRGRGGDVTNMRDWGSALWEGWASGLPGEGAAAATFVPTAASVDPGFLILKEEVQEQCAAKRRNLTLTS